MPDHSNSSNLNNQPYLVKLLTMLVKRSNGAIRVPASELMAQDVGHGIRIWWDESTKELVIDYQPTGAKVYTITEAKTWLTNESLSPSLPVPKAPLTQEDLVSRIWTESAGTQTVEETRRPPNKSKVTHLTDLSMANAEAEKVKAEALRALAEWPGEQPARHSRPLTTFSK